MSEEELLSEREQLFLARLINACVKKASGKLICPKTKQDPDIKEKKVNYFFKINIFHIFLECYRTKSRIINKIFYK